MKPKKNIRIVCVSPGDVNAERAAVKDAVDFFRRIASSQGFSVELARWESIPPDMDVEGIQKRIDDDLDIPNSQIVIGIFANRYGVIEEPPYSRTAMEILAAARAKRESSPTMKLMVYFLESVEGSDVDPRERAKVETFRKELEQQNIRYAQVSSSVFPMKVLADLVSYLPDTHESPKDSDFLFLISSSPSKLRIEGQMEEVAPLQIRVVRKHSDTTEPARETVDIHISTIAPLTTPNIDEDRVDIRLRQEGEHSPLSIGRRIDARTVAFEALTLKASNVYPGTLFLVENIRVAPIFFGRHPIPAFVTVKKAGEPSSATPIINQLIDLGSAAEGMGATGSWEENGQTVLTRKQKENHLTITVKAPFEGSFKSRAGETGKGTIPAETGTLIEMRTSLPDGVDLFASVSDVGHEYPITALLLTVEQNGPDSSGGKLLARDQRTKMVRASNSSHVNLKWEVVSDSALMEVEFAFMVKVERDAKFLPLDLVFSIDLSPPMLSGYKPDSNPVHELASVRHPATASVLLRLDTPRTYLLFPFVLSRFDFDTVLVITNTGADPFGTKTKGGPCKFHFYGTCEKSEHEPMVETYRWLDPGQTLSFSLWLGSQEWMLPSVNGFSGYVIVECEFEYAAGFGLVGGRGSDTKDGRSYSYPASELFPDRALDG